MRSAREMVPQDEGRRGPRFLAGGSPDRDGWAEGIWEMSEAVAANTAESRCEVVVLAS